MAYGLLEKWGHQGFFNHVRSVANFYCEKRDVFIQCMDKHLQGLATWVVPDSGMFVWIRMLGGIQDSQELIHTKAIEKRVLAVPGIVSQAFFFPYHHNETYILYSRFYPSQAKRSMCECLTALLAMTRWMKLYVA